MVSLGFAGSIDSCKQSGHTGLRGPRRKCRHAECRFFHCSCKWIGQLQADRHFSWTLKIDFVREILTVR